MFYIDSNPILVEDIKVLEELRSQLAANGLNYFNEFKVGEMDIQFNCPIHSGGQERKPSCGITRVKKGTLPPGTVHCFTCGYTSNLQEMVSHVFGHDDMGRFGTEWLVKNFLTLSIENRQPIELDLNRGQKKEEADYVSEEELNKYRYYHPYMYKRKLTNKIIELFDIGYDDFFQLTDKEGQYIGNIKAITFPVRDKQGRTLFIGRRSVTNKVFHYPEGVNKPLYGVYELPKEPEDVIVCESFIDALTCYVYGRPAVALLGLGTQEQVEQLRKLPTRKLIFGLDSDEAGQKATEKLRKKLNGYKITTRLDIPHGKDLNDLSEKEFNNLQEIF